MQLVVLKSIFSEMPEEVLNNFLLDYIKDMPIADPSFDILGHIDVLLGADVFPMTLLSGQIYGSNGQPSALETIFGWVLMGPVENRVSLPITSVFVSVSNDLLEHTFKKF